MARVCVEHKLTAPHRISRIKRFQNSITVIRLVDLMFIIVPTNAHVRTVKFVLKLLRHVSVFLHHPQ